MGVLEQAIAFAAEKHAGAVRKGSDVPYIAHPMEACAIAAGITNDHEILAAAVLHDVVEDTPVMISEIESAFGKRIAALVASESEDKMTGVPAAESWEIRKSATVNALKSASFDEKIIVLADKLSNIRSIYQDMSSVGEAIWERFNQKDKKKHEWYYREIAAALDDLSDYPAYGELCRIIDLVFLNYNN